MIKQETRKFSSMNIPKIEAPSLEKEMLRIMNRLEKMWHHRKIMNFGVKPASKSWRCGLGLLAMRLWASSLTFLSLNSLLHDMGIISITSCFRGHLAMCPVLISGK